MSLPLSLKQLTLNHNQSVKPTGGVTLRLRSRVTGGCLPWLTLVVSCDKERHVSSDAQIELEMWEGPLSKRERLSEATPRALREALSRLDGNRTDCVWIEIEDVGALSI